jgi:thioredoxin-like negative regulator of GroEL
MKKLLFVLFSAIAVTTASVSAQSPNYNQAVKEYNEGHYAHAQSQFESLKASYPNNALVRYYAGLCYQANGNFATAKSEFEYVANCDDARLRAMANAGIAQLSRAHTATHSSSRSPTIVAVNQAKTSSGSGNEKGKVKKVISFYKERCTPCQIFDSVFDDVKSQMSGDIQFERYDVNDPQGKEVADRYKFQEVPHVVFLDERGNLLYNSIPQMNANSFKSQIESFNK